MKRPITALLMLLCLCCTIAASAQHSKEKEKNKEKNEEQKEEEKVPVFNYVVDDPMDVFGRDPGPKVADILFPEFYAYYPSYKNDTMFRYYAYDRRDSIIDVDTLKDIDQVRYISLYKSYTDKLNTYKDANGKEQPLPVSKIIRRYDKLGTSKWMIIDYATNKYTELKEDKQTIVRMETVMTTHPVTHANNTRVQKYYKVAR
jgi:hypothetical protein